MLLGNELQAGKEKPVIKLLHVKLNKPGFISLISILLLVAATFFSIKHLALARQNQTDRINLSEVNSIQYGLLNASEWKDELTNIITTKIEEFELTDENREQLKEQVESLMYKLLNQVDQILKDDMGKIKKFLMNAFVDLDKLRENVPQLSEQLLIEITKPENKENLKQFLNKKLNGFVEDTFSYDEQKKLQKILNEENCDSKEEAATKLQNRIDKNSREIIIYIVLIFITLLSVFLLNILTAQRNSKTGLLLLVVTTLLFLANGITVPMIDIEAKITSLTFQLMGENIVFINQVIFFQSKSILDVVYLLIANGKPDMIFVGILIFGFSVLFPVSKIICSALLIQWPDRFSKSKFVQFFTFKSSKWSMADVFVVAMFMAFIGFNGIIGKQLDQLQNVNNYVEILTTNGTNLKSGFYLFLSFCLAGLFLSVAVHKKFDQHSS